MSAAIDGDITLLLPSLKQKFLVELVNGIDVGRDHIRVQKTRDGFVNRLFDSFTGDSHRRQNHVNDLVINGLESSFKWLSNLTEEITLTNKALIQVSHALTKIKQELTCVANFAADTKEQLDNFQCHVDQRFNQVEMKIREVDFRQRAWQQADALFHSWNAGNFVSLSLAQRCFLVITELAWGVFGDYCKIANSRDCDEILINLRNRMIAQIIQDANITHNTRVDSSIWLEQRQALSEKALQYQQAVSYLGSNISLDQQAFTWYVLNSEAERPICVPYIMDASRLYKGIANDLLNDGYLYGN
ncbi:MAG: hypothetical protein COB58_00325 [Thalassobium sp.]|nr:MAG: hypothetical protein COB58_12310 [Thalassobium sp.]PHQ88302.1 MAG: hypothetical protein COB58_00325 [Thalassobium sp.]